MKKLLALLFVCAGLTAMAAPHVNKADLTQANKGQMVMKSNTLANQLTAQVMNAPKGNFTNNLTPTRSRFTPNNLVEAKRAPKRLSDDDMAGMNSICFLYAAEYDDDGNLVMGDPFYAGAGAYWQVYQGQLYFAGFYWDDKGSTYYLPLDIDYTTGDVSLSWGLLLVDDTISTNARTRNDTVRWEALFSQDYFENQNQNDCKGTLYTDGSIIFSDNYVYYREYYIKHYTQNVLRSTDTIVNITVYVGTEILTANGELTYTSERDGSAGSSNVYIYQSNDTVFVGNMWDYGMPNSYMVLDYNNKATYPCATFSEEDSTNYLFNPIWDINDSYVSGGLGMFYPVGSYTLDADGYIDDYTWGFVGDATPDQISWDYTMPCNGYHFLYGYQDNVLKYTNGMQFVIPTAPGPDFIRGDVDNNGTVNIADVTTLIDHLLSGDLDDADDFSSDAADCDENGSLGISDVTALIDFLLNGNWGE